MEPGNINRAKLLNAILFFAKNTKYTGLTKICKLLYFLDFMHFKQVGYPSIGLQYEAFPKGPVPKKFWLEVKDGRTPDDFKKALLLVTNRDEYDPARRGFEFRAKQEPDLSFFSPCEIKILEEVAFIFRESKAREISEVSHLKNQPWDQTIRSKGLNAPIDYRLALDADSKIDKEEAEEDLREYFEILGVCRTLGSYTERLSKVVIARSPAKRGTTWQSHEIASLRSQ